MAGYQRLKQQLDARQQSLEQFRKEFRIEAADVIRSRVRADHEQRIAELQSMLDGKYSMREQLMQRLEAEKEMSGATQADVVDLEFARAELGRQEEVFEKISNRIVQMQTEEVAPARVEEVDEARAATKPDGSPSPILLLAGFGGLFLPLALATVWELLAQRVTDTTGIRQQDLEVVGEIAMLPRYLPSANSSGSNDAGRQLTLFQESVDHLCTTMRLSRNFRDKQMIAIASAISGEGKTHVAIQLAISLAQSCKEQVLLVEADFRQPNMVELMGVDPEFGFLDVLTGKVELEEAILRDAEKHLDLLVSGERTEEPPLNLGYRVARFRVCRTAKPVPLHCRRHSPDSGSG